MKQALYLLLALMFTASVFAQATGTATTPPANLVDLAKQDPAKAIDAIVKSPNDPSVQAFLADPANKQLLINAFNKDATLIAKSPDLSKKLFADRTVQIPGALLSKYTQQLVPPFIFADTAADSKVRVIETPPPRRLAVKDGATLPVDKLAPSTKVTVDAQGNFFVCPEGASCTTGVKMDPALFKDMTVGLVTDATGKIFITKDGKNLLVADAAAIKSIDSFTAQQVPGATPKDTKTLWKVGVTTTDGNKAIFYADSKQAPDLQFFLDWDSASKTSRIALPSYNVGNRQGVEITTKDMTVNVVPTATTQQTLTITSRNGVLTVVGNAYTALGTMPDKEKVQIETGRFPPLATLTSVFGGDPPKDGTIGVQWGKDQYAKIPDKPEVIVTKDAHIISYDNMAKVTRFADASTLMMRDSAGFMMLSEGTSPPTVVLVDKYGNGYVDELVRYSGQAKMAYPLYSVFQGEKTQTYITAMDPSKEGPLTITMKPELVSSMYERPSTTSSAIIAMSGDNPTAATTVKPTDSATTAIKPLLGSGTSYVEKVPEPGAPGATKVPVTTQTDSQPVSDEEKAFGEQYAKAVKEAADAAAAQAAKDADATNKAQQAAGPPKIPADMQALKDDLVKLKGEIATRFATDYSQQIAALNAQIKDYKDRRSWEGDESYYNDMIDAATKKIKNLQTLAQSDNALQMNIQKQYDSITTRYAALETKWMAENTPKAPATPGATPQVQQATTQPAQQGPSQPSQQPTVTPTPTPIRNAPSTPQPRRVAEADTSVESFFGPGSATGCAAGCPQLTNLYKEDGTFVAGTDDVVTNLAIVRLQRNNPNFLPGGKQQMTTDDAIQIAGVAQSIYNDAASQWIAQYKSTGGRVVSSTTIPTDPVCYSGSCGAAGGCSGGGCTWVDVAASEGRAKEVYEQPTDKDPTYASRLATQHFSGSDLYYPDGAMKNAVFAYDPGSNGYVLAVGSGNLATRDYTRLNPDGTFKIYKLSDVEVRTMKSKVQVYR